MEEEENEKLQLARQPLWHCYNSVTTLLQQCYNSVTTWGTTMLNNITLVLQTLLMWTLLSLFGGQSAQAERFCPKQPCRRLWDVKKRPKKPKRVQGGTLSLLMTVYTGSTHMSFHLVLTKLINTTKPGDVSVTPALVGSCRPPDWLRFSLSFYLKGFKGSADLKREDCVEGCRLALHCRRLIAVYTQN